MEPPGSAAQLPFLSLAQNILKETETSSFSPANKNKDACSTAKCSMPGSLQAALPGNQRGGWRDGWMADKQQLKGGHKGNSTVAELQAKSNEASTRTIAIVNCGEM